MSSVAEKLAKLQARADRFRKVSQEAEQQKPAPLDYESRKQFNETPQGQYFQYAEVQRIVQVPVKELLTDEQVEAYCRANMQAKAYAEGDRLYRDQAQALYDYELVGGLVGNLAVGSGKTLIAMGIANKAFAKGIRKMVLLYPPSLTSQVVGPEAKRARHMIGINFPIHVLAGRSSAVRLGMAKQGKPGLYLMPYSLLSGKDAYEILSLIRPELVMADESHQLANQYSARTRRLMKVLEEYAPELVILSGTHTNKSPREYHHLIKVCLGDFSPLPHSVTLTEEWSALIDAQAGSVTSLSQERDESNAGAAGPILPLVKWARDHFEGERFAASVPGFRKAYNRRFRTTPGVASSQDSDFGVSLTICNREQTEEALSQKYGESFELLKAMIRDVAEAYVTPTGDEISHAMFTWKWLNELTAGFYNELYWPSPEQYIEHRPTMSLEEAAELLDAAKKHHEAVQEYDRELRDFLRNGSPSPGVDTPFLLGQEMHRHGNANVPHNLYETWAKAKELHFPGIPERASRAVRVCPFKIDAAVVWARKEVPKGKGAVLWYFHQEAGKWLYEALIAAGLDALHCPAGDRANKAIVDPENAHRLVVASMSAHGVGKNLQYSFSHQYFLQWPRSARAAEQVLGRLHRKGQPADEIEANMFMFDEFEHMNFAACINDALYAHQTTGTRQKLIYCGYDPLPRIFPPEVLRERGLEPKSLDDRHKKLYFDRFSS